MIVGREKVCFFRSVTTGSSTASQRKVKNEWAARTILGRLKTKGGLDLGGEGERVGLGGTGGDGD